MPGKSLKSHLYPNNKIVMTRGRYTSVKIESLIAMFAIKKLIVFLIVLFLNNTAKTRKLPVMAKGSRRERRDAKSANHVCVVNETRRFVYQCFIRSRV